MAADINTSMGVTGLSEYKRAMGEAKESVKTLDAQLKLNEEQLKANGNAELYMANKAELLKKQIEEQKKVVSSAEKALDEMKKKGVDESSKSFQKMNQEVWNAATKLMSMRTELKNVESGAEGAKKETQGMNTELKQVGQGIAWQNVTEGLHKITESMKNGAQAAVNLGKKIAKSAMDSTGWADDVLTRATKYGVDAETVQRMDRVAEFIDTDVDTIIAAQAKLAKNRESLGELLGLDVAGKSVDEAFWEAGEAISAMTDEWEREEAAQKVFGRGWKELLPLFTAGQEKYNQLMEEQTVLSNENVKKLGEADDAIKSIEQQVQLMKNQFWADNADKIIELLQWIIDNKDGIVTALTVIAGGFGLLKMGEFAVNVGQAVNGMKELLNLGKSGTPSIPEVPGAQNGGGNGTGLAGKTATGGFLAKAASAVKDFFIGGAGTPLLVLGAGLAPAMIAQNQVYAEANETRERRLNAAAGENSLEKQFLAQAAEALHFAQGKNQDYAMVVSLLEGMENRSGIEMSKLHNMLSGSVTSQGNYTWNELQRLWNGEEFDTGRLVATLEAVTDAYEKAVTALEPEFAPDAQVNLQEQANQMTVKVGAELVLPNVDGEHANGLPFVPFDGYLSILHKGERVVPAREVAASRNFSSNLYVESMYMNNGQDADGLAARVAAENRRIMSGYGS